MRARWRRDRAGVILDAWPAVITKPWDLNVGDPDRFEQRWFAGGGLTTRRTPRYIRPPFSQGGRPSMSRLNAITNSGEPRPRSAEFHAWWLPKEDRPIVPMDMARLPAALLQSVRIPEPQRPTRFGWIIFGVVVLFAFVAGGSYWWLGQQGHTPVAAKVAPPASMPARPAPAAAPAIAAAPSPQLAVGLLDQPSPDPVTAPVASQSSLPTPSEPPQLAVGLPSLTDKPLADAPTPAAESTLPVYTPLSPAPPKPSRKATALRSSPTANPGQPSGFVKF
jgi:hypothetical protein